MHEHTRRDRWALGLSLLLLASCGSEASPPAPSEPAGPEAVVAFPRPAGPLDAASFFPRASAAWVRASTSPGVPLIASAITGVSADGVLELTTTNGPGRVRATVDELAFVDGLGHTIEVWLHTPLEVGTTWHDAGAPLGCASTITEGVHASELFGRPVPACITVRAECRGHDDSSVHIDTWCAGLGRVHSEIVESGGSSGASYETFLVAFSSGGEVSLAPPDPHASPPYDDTVLSGLLASVSAPLP
jgi:hypothetical protein